MGFRKWFESIAYAGMKPAAARRGKRLRWLGPLGGPVGRFLDGGVRPDDPFYLTNRTAGQKLRLALVIAVPCLFVLGGLSLVAFGYLRIGRPPKPAPVPSPEQIAAKLLPNLDKDLRVEGNRNVEVVDVHVEPGSPTKVAGTVRNNTDHPVVNAELVFELTDGAGSRVGAVSTTVARIEPRATVPFVFPVAQNGARFALVREIQQH